jgi:predicted N-acetyltransferase YhbS
LQQGSPKLITIVPLARIAPERIEDLLDAAFGTDRKARTAYRLRAGTTALAHLSFAALEGEALMGSLQSWPVRLDGVGLTLVGPVAVSPDRQRGGIGRLLMEALMAAAGDAPMMMIGDPEYYGRFFGFSSDVTGNWALPGPFERHRLLARNVPSSLAGDVVPDVTALAA